MINKLRTVAGLALSVAACSGCAALNRNSIGLRGMESESESSLLRMLDPVDQDASGALMSMNDRENEADEHVANPPAKTIRFSGKEVVLGLSHTAVLEPSEFRRRLKTHLADRRLATAHRFLESHPGAATRFLWDNVTSGSLSDLQDEEVQFVASVYSKRVSDTGDWQSLIGAIERDPSTWAEFKTVHAKYLADLRSTGAAEDALAEQLRIAGESVKHPIVIIETLRLLAGRESLAGNHPWAESLCLQAAEIAVQTEDFHRSADIMLEVCKAIEMQVETPGYDTRHKKAWLTAVELQMRALKRTRLTDVQFWTAAHQSRSEGYDWPIGVVEQLRDEFAELGCTVGSNTKPDTVLWAAIGFEHYTASRHQQALLSLKKAEQTAEESNRRWLRIAQGKCLASLGQQGAAAAILSGPAASSSPAVACAAKAAIGSAKLAAGAYQQGAQLLNRALTESPALAFPGKLDAEADRAVAIAILGDTDTALKALRGIQAAYSETGDRHALLQALDNEKRLLEIDSRTEEAQLTSQRIAELELQWGDDR